MNVPTVDPASESTLQRAEWQKILFAPFPSRAELAKLNPGWPCRAWQIRIHRNHAFEHVAAASRAWLAFAKRTVEWSYSSYDDAFSFEGVGLSGEVTAEMIWADVAAMQRNMSRAEIVEWLFGRTVALRALTTTPILVVAVGLDPLGQATLAAKARTLPGVRVGEPSAILAVLGDRAFDARAMKLSGTRLSDRAMILLARELACRWLPALAAPRLKAVAVDLDQTLYAGVLGEDGTQVQLTPGHLALQKKLAVLQEDGLFLAVISKNEPQDVERLFAERKDFPVQPKAISAWSVGWQGKAQGMREIAKTLRIGPDSILFLDDNPGELVAVCAEIPEINTLYVEPGAEMTARALEYFPGLWAWERTETDALRSADLQAEIQRAELTAQYGTPEAYLESLKVELTFATNPVTQAGRIHELSQKTNQFNVSLARLSETAVAEALQPDGGFAVTVALRDRLSDSGIIGVLVGRRSADALEVTDLTVSCRALGRKLEDLMVFGALRALRQPGDPANVRFHYRRGPRNQPALEWLARVSGAELAEAGSVLLPLPDVPPSLAKAVKITTL